jgi:hypothetical protein
MTLQDLNALSVGDEAELVQVYGSLEAAHDRYRHLRDSGQIGPDSAAFWTLDGPEFLRTFETWLDTTGIAPPATREQQIDLDIAFDRARAKWLEQQGHQR